MVGASKMGAPGETARNGTIGPMAGGGGRYWVEEIVLPWLSARL